MWFYIWSFYCKYSTAEVGILPQEQQFQVLYSRHSSQQKYFKKCSAIENKAMTFLLIIVSICFSVFKSFCFLKWFPIFSQSWPWVEVHLNLSYSKREDGVVYWQYFPPTTSSETDEGEQVHSWEECPTFSASCPSTEAKVTPAPRGESFLSSMYRIDPFSSFHCSLTTISTHPLVPKLWGGAFLIASISI